MTTTPVRECCGFALLSFPPTPGFAPLSCPPPPGFSQASCPPTPGLAPLSCPPPPGFAHLSCPPPPGFAQASCPPQSGFIPASCPPPPGFPPASCHPPLTIADHICTLIQSITARSNNIVNKELEKCIDSYSKSIWADTFYCEYMKMYPSPQGIEAFSFDEERFLVVANIIGRILLNNLQLEMLLSVEDFNVDEVGSSGSVDLNLAIPETANPVKVVDITTPLTTNPVNLEVLDETLVLQSGFSPAHCTPPPEFAPTPCTPPPGFALTTYTSSPSFVANAMQGFGTKVILKQMVLLFLERLPPSSEDLESEFLTITDRICTLFQSITARFRNIVNEELEKCTDSDSKKYWAYTFYWEYMKRYPSSQCLGIEAFTCDEERCLVVAKVFAKKMCPKMLPSAADFDEAEDSGSNGSVDLNLAIPETANPVKVVDITTPLTTNPVNLEVLDETLVLQSGFSTAHCTPPPGFSPAPCTPPTEYSPALCIPPPGFALATCTSSPSFAANAMQGFGRKVILKQMVLLFLERLPPASEDLESEFLTITDRICTLFQSITARFRNIVNEELEKCTDSDSKKYWAYTFYWEYMKRYPSSQCLGIEAFTCDEERCLVVAKVFAKKMCPKMLPSAADFDEAEDSGSNGSVDLNLAIPETANPVKVVDITTPLTTNPVNLEVLDETLVLQSGFSTAHCTPPPGFSPAPCTPPTEYSPALCIPPPGFALATCTSSPSFAANAMQGFGRKVILKQMVLLFLERLPPASEDLESEFLTITDRICTLFQSITARFRNIVNEELEKCTDADSMQYWAYTFYWEYIKRYPSSQCLGIEAFTCDEERCLVVAKLFAKKMCPKMLPSAADVDKAEDSGSNGSVDLNLAILETANPVKVVDITTPLTTNPVNLEVLDETLVLQSGFSTAHCTPPPGFSPAPCTPPTEFSPALCIPPPGFALATCTSSPSFAANAMQGFGRKVILKQMVLLFLERLPPASEDLESEFLTITDRICTLFQSITARFRNIVNEELEKCTDADSMQYWAYTFYWEYIKRYPSSQCLGIEAFTCDEERCLVVAKLFAKKMCPKMLPSAADVDKAEDSGSNGSVDLNLAILETANPVKVVDITTPLTTNPVNLEVLDETLVLQSGFVPAPCIPPPGFSPAPCIPPPGFSPAPCIPPSGFPLTSCTASPSFAANAMQGFGTKIILKQMVLLFLERHPPISDDLESEFLTIADHICTLFQSITDRFGNIVNEELEKCTDSDSKQYWAYTLDWEYMKRCPSSQCLGIEAFTCDEERCLVLATLFAKKLYPKMFLSAADVDKAEDSGSNGVSKGY
ncbi:uncharacterized protein LOC116357428 [Oncorhynchus kisutch]|uniref:uncharacterized protein LOC116357428 n=1 Tax=Oncorhynchus kisutch TaxID=8019 RepID=UPI0012DBDB81|nr:uncharacterized protein LOC116357428 [Oncorhynchus kisutch]